MIENQSFQSVLQLAVALNIGYAAIASIYGTSMSKERAKIESLLDTAKTVRDLSIESGKADLGSRKNFADVVSLRHQIIEKISENDNFLFNIARWIAIFSAISSFILLYFTTFYPSNSASDWIIWGSIIVNAPFVIFIIYSAARSVLVLRPIQRQRERLDQDLTRKLEEIMSA